jgi:HAE1 family hydrophobic/amphiphilic exporter-1
VQVEFEFGTDLDASVAAMQASLGRIQAQLPQSVTPQVFAGSTDNFPVWCSPSARPATRPRSCRS